MRYCRNCGSPLQDGDKVCKSCQTEVMAERKGMDQDRRPYMSSNSISGNRNLQNAYGNNAVSDKWDYTPISMWGYLGYEILFMIPLIGIILLLVFSFGGTQRINVRNFARSYFCLLIILIILLFVLGISISSILASIYYW